MKTIPVGQARLPHPNPLPRAGEGANESQRETSVNELEVYWQQLGCGFPRVAEVFSDCMRFALANLTEQGIAAYIEYAGFLGKMGRGAEPILIFLEEWPGVAKILGEDALSAIAECIRRMYKSPNGKAIVPFLQSLPSVARRLPTKPQMQEYLNLIVDFMESTTGSIHGIHQTFASPGLPSLFKQINVLLGQLSLAGLKKWLDYGVRFYNDHPERQIDYFSLQSADSRAVLQRERHGTLLMDNERKLDMYLRGLWQDEEQLIPYSTLYDELRKPVPYYDKLGIRVPDVYSDFIVPSPSGRGAGGRNGEFAEHALHPSSGSGLPVGTRTASEGDEPQRVAGIDRYRAVLAHIVAHRRWSTAIFADNFSPFQRMAVEFLEDSRVEYLAMQEYPGLRRIFTGLHPVPDEHVCDA